MRIAFYDLPIEGPTMSTTSASLPLGATGAAPATGILRGRLPGVILTGLVAAAAYFFRTLPGLAIVSPMILAIIVGVVFSNTVGSPAHAKLGILFCQKTLLRLAIVLLGFQLTWTQIASIGITGFVIVGSLLITTIVITFMLGRFLGVDPRLTQLIAAGTSICGASAIVATNAITRADDEDVAYAVAAITLFGTIAMFLFPFLAPVLGLDSRAFGLWVGASVHEVAQVIGASFQHSDLAGEIGTVAKLVRVAMLAPVVIVLGMMLRTGKESGAVKPPTPWFVLGFLAAVSVNSFVTPPADVRILLGLTTTALLTMGLAAMGLQTSVLAIQSRGVRPLLLAFLSFVYIAAAGLMLVKFAS